MKTILCYGDSNTWGYPALEQFPLPNTTRYGADVRWASVLRTHLGDGYTVIEEGLCGRTTVWDDPIEGEFLNGKSYLIPCLRSHSPLDLVIIMLGTNDLKSRFGLTAADIAEGVGTLADVVQHSETGPHGTAPQVLLIAPTPLTRLTAFAHMFAGSEVVSRQLAMQYKRVAAAHNCAYFDAGSVIQSSDLDGVHFSPESQQVLGRSLMPLVQQLLK